MFCLTPRSGASVGIARSSASARRWEVPFPLDVVSVLEFGSDVRGTSAVGFVFDRIWLGGGQRSRWNPIVRWTIFFASNVVRVNVAIQGPQSAR